MKALEQIIKDRNHIDREIKEATYKMNYLYDQILVLWESIEKKKLLSDEYTEIINKVNGD